MDGMRAVVGPSGSPSVSSQQATFFRWCLGGMAASARDADAGASALVFGRKEAEADCGHISASQMDLLARADVINGGGGGGGGGGAVEEEEAEVFSTPPLTHQDPQRQGQSQRRQEDGIAMCSVPLTQTQPSPSPSSFPPSDSQERKPRKPRICIRKVRGGAKIRTPTPSPNPSPSPSPGPELDPLVRNVLMIRTTPLPTTGHEDILEVARSCGIF